MSALLRWFACAVVTLLWLTPAMILCRVMPSASTWFLKSWCETQLKIFGIQISVTDRNCGKYDSPPYLYVHLNQTSLAETFVMHSVMPTEGDVFMNLGYALLPFVGWFAWFRGGVTVVLQWPWQIRRAMEKVIRRLKSGKNFYMSIEGKRSRDGTLGPYRKGAAIIAINSKATVIPMIIHGAREILPYGEWRIKPGKVEVIFCEAISTRELTYEDRDELTKRLRLIAERELKNG